MELFAGSPEGAGRMRRSGRHRRLATRSPAKRAGGADGTVSLAAAWVGQNRGAAGAGDGAEGEAVGLVGAGGAAGDRAAGAACDVWSTESRKDGVRVTWNGNAPHFRVFRATGDAMPATSWAIAIRRSIWMSRRRSGSTYRYYVMALAAERNGASCQTLRRRLLRWISFLLRCRWV